MPASDVAHTRRKCHCNTMREKLGNGRSCRATCGLTEKGRQERSCRDHDDREDGCEVHIKLQARQGR